MAKILIVDDSRTSRRMLRNILVENGHEVIGEAENGQIGFEKYIELKPDIVTLDITMPVLDGLGALEKIIAYDENAHAVMVTAAGQKSKMVDAIKLGANEFVQKPFEPDQILSVIGNITKNIRTASCPWWTKSLNWTPSAAAPSPRPISCAPTATL